MVWVQLEAAGLDCPLAADELVRRAALERLQPAGAVVGEQERVQVLLQLARRGVVEGAHRCVLDGAVHPLDLPVGPGVVGLGEPVLDAVGHADAVEAVHAVGRRARLVGELDTPVSFADILRGIASRLSLSTVWMR